MHLLTVDLANFRSRHPHVQLDILVTNHALNLETLDADVAVRPTLAPPDQLIGRRVCDIGFAVYAHTDWEQMYPDADLSALPWLGIRDHWLHRVSESGWKHLPLSVGQSYVVTRSPDSDHFPS